MATRPPVPVPWPSSSAPGARAQESAGRLINSYCEPLQVDSAPAKMVWRKTPGLSRFAISGFTGYRGGILVGNLAYFAFSGKLVTVDIAGVVTLVGTLSGTKRVTFARNNLVPTPNVCCVTENGAFLVTPTTINAWPDADLPQPNSVSFQDSYFFWTIGDRRAFASGINATSVDALCFTTIQSRSSDTMLRGIPYGGMMLFFCTSSTEVFQDAGASISAPAFPYSRVAVIDRGLLGANAIAGWEDGFGNLFWAADDFGVYNLPPNTLVPNKISSPDLDRLIKAADPTTLEANCYVHAGHSIFVISSPTWSWEFNIGTQRWTERLSTVAGLYQRWAGTGSIYAFGKWLMGSTVTGNIVNVDDTSYKEEGQTMMWRMESGPVQNFPNRIRVGRADFDFMVGQGIPGGLANEQEPRVSISWSDDGGIRWSVPVLRRLGRNAEGVVRVSIVGCGQSGPQGRRWRVEVGDAVYVGFLGSTQSANPRAN